MILKDKVALVTGAAQGIGKAIALKLANNGAEMIISDVNLDKAQETSKDIEKLGRRAVALKANVASLHEAETMMGEAVNKLGAIHILVNNAGITRDNLVLRMKEEDWDAVIGVNLKGVFLCSKEAVKVMSKQRYGRIVNIASVVAFMGNQGQANYSASKAGVVGLTKTIAKEYASRNITSNAVAP